jgi:hypothetical protein
MFWFQKHMLGLKSKEKQVQWEFIFGAVAVPTCQLCGHNNVSHVNKFCLSFCIYVFLLIIIIIIVW